MRFGLEASKSERSLLFEGGRLESNMLDRLMWSADSSRSSSHSSSSSSSSISSSSSSSSLVQVQAHATAASLQSDASIKKMVESHFILLRQDVAALEGHSLQSKPVADLSAAAPPAAGSPGLCATSGDKNLRRRRRRMCWWPRLRASIPSDS